MIFSTPTRSNFDCLSSPLKLSQDQPNPSNDHSDDHASDLASDHASTLNHSALKALKDVSKGISRKRKHCDVNLPEQSSFSVDLGVDATPKKAKKKVLHSKHNDNEKPDIESNKTHTCENSPRDNYTGSKKVGKKIAESSRFGMSDISTTTDLCTITSAFSTVTKTSLLNIPSNANKALPISTPELTIPETPENMVKKTDPRTKTLDLLVDRLNESKRIHEIHQRNKESLKPRAKLSLEPRAKPSINSRAKSSAMPRVKPRVKPSSTPSATPRAKTSTNPSAVPIDFGQLRMDRLDGYIFDISI